MHDQMESDPESFDQVWENLWRTHGFCPSNTESQAERDKWRSLYENCSNENRSLVRETLRMHVSSYKNQQNDYKKKIAEMADDCKKEVRKYKNQQNDYKKKIAEMADDCKKEVRKYKNQQNDYKKKIAAMADDCKKEVAAMADDCKKEVQKYTIEGLLVDQHEFPCTKKGGTVSGAHSSYNYDRAMASQSKQFVNKPIDPELLPDRTKRRHSIMLCKFDGGMQTFGSEADIQSYVRSALEDAVTVVQGLIDGNGDGENNLLTIRAEASMFSNRPDLIAVSYERFHGMPLFAVEVKQPWKGKINDRIWGQVHDYGEFMRLQGHYNPFVVLSSLNESYLVWNANDVSCDRVAKENHNRFTKATFAQIWKSLHSQRLVNTPSPRGVEDPKESMPRTDKSLDRNLFHSESTTSKDLVCLLVNGLICSLTNF